MKYHCTKRLYQDLSLEDKLFRGLKVANLGKLVVYIIVYSPI